MPKQINTPSFGSALVRAFNLKGRFQPVLDDTIVPVSIVNDLSTSGGSVSRRHAGGYTNWVWTSGGSRRAIIGVENPATSGVDIHLTGANLGWSFAGGASYVSQPLARQAFIWRVRLGPIVSGIDLGTGTTSDSTEWHNTELIELSTPGPFAELISGYTNTSLTGTVESGQLVVPEIMSPILVDTAPATLAIEARGVRAVPLETLILTPGQAAYASQIGNVSVSAGAFWFGSFEWDEVSRVGS